MVVARVSRTARLVMVFHHPYQKGEPLAVLDNESGTPLEMRYVSDGQEQRLPVELDCRRCSFPIEGVLTAAVDGAEIKTVEIGGPSDYMSSHRTLEEHRLTNILRALCVDFVSPTRLDRHLRSRLAGSSVSRERDVGRGLHL